MNTQRTFTAKQEQASGCQAISGTTVKALHPLSECRHRGIFRTAPHRYRERKGQTAPHSVDTATR